MSFMLCAAGLSGCSFIPGGKAMKNGWDTVLHELKPHRLMRWNMATEPMRGPAYFSVPPPNAAIEEAAAPGGTALPEESEIE